jgi:hypothetical protein
MESGFQAGALMAVYALVDLLLMKRILPTTDTSRKWFAVSASARAALSAGLFSSPAQFGLMRFGPERCEKESMSRKGATL